jgi:hypothetical protein
MKALPPAFRSIPSGGELIEALDQAFGKHRGWIQATGFVDDIELRVGSDGSDASRTFRGRFALAAFGGPLGGPYGATLSRAVGEHVEVLAGVLVRARSGGVAALCVSAGDAPLRGVGGPSLGDEPEPLAAQASDLAKRPLMSAFAAKVGITQPAVADDAEDEGVLPERGDLVEHFAFGMCEVVLATGERLVLRDVGGRGRTREIESGRLSITGPVEHDGRRLFRLAKR